MVYNWLMNFAYTILLNHSSSDRESTPSNVQLVPCPSEENRKMLEKRSLEKYAAAGFQMPLHYPRYTKSDYEKMEEWKIDMLLGQYGLDFRGNLEEKRKFAMGAFLWPDQF